MSLETRIKKIEPLQTPEYRMPTEVYFGRGRSSLLPEVVRKSPASRLLLVSGEHFLKSSESQDLIRALEQTGRVETYQGKIKKSDFETVDRLVRFVQDTMFDGIIGIGGGAVLDSAKVAAILAENGGIAEDYLISKTRNIGKRGAFYIAVPTTSGTGSEVVPWAVVWGDKKYSLSSSEFMFPNTAIVDPALTDNCPEYITATAGIDAMCQAIEAYWNVNHNPRSDKYALESIRIILENLANAVNNPTQTSRDKMAWGSLTGGLAFSNTATTICHSVSYPMTLHWGITHGQATSITLPAFIEYTFSALDDTRRHNILNAMAVEDDKAAAEKVRGIMCSIGLKTNLRELRIPKEGIDVIVAEGFDPSRAHNVPRIPSKDELKRILVSIY